MSISNQKVFKNATWIVACKIVQSLISLVIGTISARYLGPSNYGLISYATSLIAFVTPLAQLGLRNIFVEQIMSHPVWAMFVIFGYWRKESKNIFG